MCTKKTEDQLRQDIDNLKNELAECRKTANELRTCLDEKAILIREIHHRVKNNLQNVTALLTLQTSYVNNEETHKILEDATKRIYSIGLVHDLLHKAKNVNSINFCTYLHELSSYIHDFYHEGKPGVSIHIDADDIALTIDKAVPCGLLLCEIITNAFKHAFKDQNGGIINISFKKDGNNATLIVKDNGVGISDVNTMHTNNSLGITLINGLAVQLNGQLAIESQTGMKTTLTFNI